MKKLFFCAFIVLATATMTAQVDNNQSLPVPPALPPVPDDGPAVNDPDSAEQDDIIYAAAAVQVQPIYPGGPLALERYIQQHFNQKNVEARIKPGSYRVYISFVVEKDGSISAAKVFREPGYGVGKEVLKVLNTNTTLWSPGMISGKNVRVSYSLPIKIQIK